MFENPRPKTTFIDLMYKITPPSSSASMRSPIHVELAPFKRSTKPDAHLKMWINLISAPLPIWMYPVHWIPHVTICFIWIHPTIHLNHKTPQVLKVLKLNLLMSLKNLWKTIGIHQQMSSMNNITMICSYSTKRFHLAISTFRTLMFVKTKMTSSSIPPTLVTSLHYPIHGTTQL